MINESEPAVPCSEMHHECGIPVANHYRGLTKREAFLMAAMQGFCANPALVGTYSCVDIWKICENARQVADQMMSQS